MRYSKLKKMFINIKIMGEKRIYVLFILQFRSFAIRLKHFLTYFILVPYLDLNSAEEAKPSLTYWLITNSPTSHVRGRIQSTKVQQVSFRNSTCKGYKPTVAPSRSDWANYPLVVPLLFSNSRAFVNCQNR